MLSRADLRSKPRDSELQQIFEKLPDFSEVDLCLQLIRTASELASRDARLWATELSPWEGLVTAVSKVFGERWVCVHLANVGSGVRSPTETCTDSTDLFDSSKSLCRRARYARLRAGTPTWWKETFERAKSPDQKMLALALWFTWASPNNVVQVVQDADGMISSLTDDNWRILFDSVENAIELTCSQPGDRQMQLNEDKMPHSLSARTLSLLRMRSKRMSCDGIFRKGLGEYKGTDTRVLKVCQNDAIERLIHFPANWDATLDILSRAYSHGVISARYSSIEFARRGPMHAIPLEIAIKIAESADKFPSFIVAAAEARCRENVAKKIRPVAKIAAEEKWFEEGH